MERNSYIYKARRKLQILASKIFSDEFLSKVYYRVVLKKRLNLKEPTTFNEKLQWLKLYYYPNSKKVIQCADKYAVRDYIKEKGYGESLVPLIGTWENADNIPWNSLPERFVLKCNHGCAYNILCPDKYTFDTVAASKQLERWLKEDFGSFNIEKHYSKIKPRKIICEEYLGDIITDYKFFCFNGKPYCMYVSSDLVNDRRAKIGFFFLDGSKMPIKRDDYMDIESIDLPKGFDNMRLMATDLSKDFLFVRVDFFVADDRCYFAELTFTPGACMMPFNPTECDLEWGKMLDISMIK